MKTSGFFFSKVNTDHKKIGFRNDSLRVPPTGSWKRGVPRSSHPIPRYHHFVVKRSRRHYLQSFFLSGREGSTFFPSGTSVMISMVCRRRKKNSSKCIWFKKSASFEAGMANSLSLLLSAHICLFSRMRARLSSLISIKWNHGVTDRTCLEL